jgi:hypothetical protein
LAKGTTWILGVDSLVTEDLVVHADPDKLFFISMLIKDIELVPAVLDLVDNCVDGARALSIEEGTQGSDHPYSGRRVDINSGRDAFEITDNCGGIDLDTARSYAFRFGRSKDYKGVAGSVGEFGVGMKRSLFKLGKQFEVKSRSKSSEFVLKVDVDKWAAETDPEWTFRLSSAKSNLKPPPAKQLGTTIKVTGLHDTVSEDFASHLVIGQLRQQLRLRHQGAIQNGLLIHLNGERLTLHLPQLLSGPSFKPFNRSMVLNEVQGDVSVRVIAGIAALEGKGEDQLNDGDAQDFRSPSDAGWWVFCNERLLLYADKTALTGWGSSGAAYHPQYRRFRGYVYLSASDTALLPWNTTKTGVDQDSRVWRKVLAVMQTALVEVQAVINKIKSEGEEADIPGSTSVTASLATATPVPVRELPESQSVEYPKPPPRRRKPKSEQKVQFNVERNRYEAVAEVLDATTTSEVGRGVFDYFYDREIEE